MQNPAPGARLPVELIISSNALCRFFAKLKYRAIACEVQHVDGSGVIDLFFTSQIIETVQTDDTLLKPWRDYCLPQIVGNMEIKLVRALAHFAGLTLRILGFFLCE
jgi:hypothetical protein